MASGNGGLSTIDQAFDSYRRSSGPASMYPGRERWCLDSRLLRHQRHSLDAVELMKQSRRPGRSGDYWEELTAGLRHLVRTGDLAADCHARIALAPLVWPMRRFPRWSGYRGRPVAAVHS